MSVKSVKSENSEKILSKDNHSYTLFPIKYKELFSLYKKAVASFWTVEEIDLSKDMNDWNKLKSDEQHFIKNILAFSEVLECCLPILFFNCCVTGLQ